MSVIDGDVGDEVADRPPVLCLAIRGVEGIFGLGVEIAEAQGHAQEPVREHGGRRQHGSGQGRAQRCGHRGILGLVDGRVEADGRGHAVGVPGRPAEREDAAPVVTDRHDRVGVGPGGGHLGEQIGDDGIEIGDAIGDATHLGGFRGGHRGMGQSFGEAHLELVGGDEPPGAGARLCGIDGGAGQPTPQIRPGRIAVEGDDRARRLHTGCGQGGQCVEHMELMRPVGGSRLDDSGPGGVPLGQLRGNRGRPCRIFHEGFYHSISVMAVLRPEPTPMHRMRSPGLRLSASRDRVMGREAGPTLPSSG